MFVLINSKSSTIENKRSLKEKHKYKSIVYKVTAVSILILLIILINNYLEKQNKKNKEKELEDKAIKKQNHLEITVEIIDDNKKYQKILPSLQLIYNPYKWNTICTAAGHTLKEQNDQKRLNNLSKEELNSLTELLLCLISIPFRSDLFRCRFCKEGCYALTCSQFNDDFWSELDLYKELYYRKDENDQNKYIKDTIIERIYSLNTIFNSIDFEKFNKKIYLINKKNSEDEVPSLDPDLSPNSNKEIIEESNNRIMIAENSTKECLGFIHYNEIFNNKENNKLTKQSIWIELLATNPKHQKKGVMSILINKLKTNNLPIALLSDHKKSMHSPGPKFYLKNNFIAITIGAFLKKANNTKDTFYHLAQSQKTHLQYVNKTSLKSIFGNLVNK